MTARPSRFDGTGRGRPSSRRWDVRRLVRTNRLWGSNGVAFGPDGRLYVAQFLAGQISAVDPASGDVEVVVPMDGPVLAPDDLAFGADGSMYITDLTPGRVWRRGPEGEYTLVSDDLVAPNGIACVGDRLFVNEMRMDGRLLELFPGGGDPVPLAGGLAMGNAMQLGPDGCLYYPHMVGDQVWRVPADGSGPPELVAERVHEPVAVRFDQGGILTVLSRGAEGIVTRIDLDTGRRWIVTSGVTGLDNAAFDGENRMFVSSYASGGVTEMHADGRTREIVPRGLDGPFGITVDLGGTVYAADHYRLARTESTDTEKADTEKADTENANTENAEDGDAVTHELAVFVHAVTAGDDGLLHLTSQTGDVRTHDPVERTTRVRARDLDEPGGIAVAPDGALVVAETGAGRIVRIGPDDRVSVLAEGLGRPVDVAFDAEGRCYASDEERGAVLRLDGGAAVPLVEGLEAPQGLAVRGGELFVVEVGRRRLLAISTATGESRIDAEDLAVGLPPGTAAPGRVRPPVPPGVPAPPRPFAGLAAGPGGRLLISANGEGSVLALSEK
ncbi:hypothetical protein [Spirillospora sp. NPDC029432]|uniref:hypothetical protein n=1 Tax=Spirillospora sp. NPDC029432 TaxID=3154599 RepID=UPI003452F680